MRRFAFPFAASVLWLVLLPHEAFARGILFSSETVSLRVAGGHDSHGGGRSLEATIRVPRGIERGRKVPAILLFGGFESAGKVLDLIHPGIPVVLASFDYPFTASRDLRFPSSLLALPEAKRLFPETIQGIHALTRELAARKDVDPERILIVGASFGAPFALAAAAEDPAIAGVAIVHGFGRVSETAQRSLLRSWEPRYGVLARPIAWMLSRALWLYLGVEEPESFARRLRPEQRVVMIAARSDSFVPREASESLWQAICSSASKDPEREEMEGDHLMPGADALIGKILGRIELWMERVLRPSPSWPKH